MQPERRRVGAPGERDDLGAHALRCDPRSMIYVDVEGEPQGPFTADELSALWRAGEIDQSARYWYRGMSDWRPVSQFVAPPETPRVLASQVELTTAPTFARRAIEREVEIVTAECVIGMNFWKDIVAGFTDTFGGRSDTTQNALRRARETCLDELRREAQRVNADGVIAVDLAYSEMSGQGKSMLFLVASGTAVRLGPPPAR